MAYEGKLNIVPGLIASGDLSSDQFKFVVIGASGVAKNTTAGGICDGVLQNKPDAAGKGAEVACGGVSKVMASAAITAGDLVASTAAGLAATATTGQHVEGRAIEAASASGDLISVLLDTDGVAP